NWLATLWGGSIKYTAAMLFAVAFVQMFLMGGVDGVFMASLAVDYQIHATYWVVSHIHYVLFGGSVFGVFGAFYYWFPKMTGRRRLITSTASGRFAVGVRFEICAAARRRAPNTASPHDESLSGADRGDRARDVRPGRVGWRRSGLGLRPRLPRLATLSRPFPAAPQPARHHRVLPPDHRLARQRPHRAHGGRRLARLAEAPRHRDSGAGRLRPAGGAGGAGRDH